MSRSSKIMRNQNVKGLRKISGDPVYGSILINKLVNKFMYDGKKSASYKLVYGAIDKSRESILNLYKEDESATGNIDFKVAVNHFIVRALNEIMPPVEVRSIRIGGANYSIPFKVNENRGCSIAMQMLIKCTRSRGERTAIDKLAYEFQNIFNGKSNAMKEKERIHKVAEANKAFAHYAAKFSRN